MMAANACRRIVYGLSIVFVEILGIITAEHSRRLFERYTKLVTLSLKLSLFAKSR